MFKTSSRKRVLLGALIVLAVLAPAIFVNRHQLRSMTSRLPVAADLLGKTTIEAQIKKYGERARGRLVSMFQEKQLAYPPDKIALVALKDKRELQVYAAYEDGLLKYVHTYPILGASGNLGPKLREGDCQVPEGLYIIESLEPNTPYHLGLRVNYPNVFDLARAKEDGRTKPGSDILIHGNTGSIGCLAMGDEASEDLFVLANDARQTQPRLIMCPVDMRTAPVPAAKAEDPPWLPALYAEIKETLRAFPSP